MKLKLTSPIAALELPEHITASLTKAGIDTVGALTAHTAYAISGLPGLHSSNATTIADALAEHDLTLAAVNTCTSCPRCPDCGTLRAVDARNVVIGLDGRARHVGYGVSDPCDGCDDYHQDLVATRAEQLAVA